TAPHQRSLAMARIEVPMPQMGESIAEGTVSKWLKKVGDEVARDEPLLEISTDKVDAEIPAPAAGVLAEIAVEEGATVEVGSVLAYIETEKGAAPAAAPPEAAAPAPEARAPEAPREAAPAEARAPAPAAPPSGDGRTETAEERLRRRSTPVVRKIAAEHGVDLAELQGTGRAGRVTKQDILAYIEEREKAPAAEPAAAPAPPAAPARGAPAGAPAGVMSADQLWDLFYSQVRHPEWPVRENDRVEPMDRIRRLTAE